MRKTFLLLHQRLAEQAALKAMKESQETGTRLIPKGAKKRTKRANWQSKDRQAEASHQAGAIGAEQIGHRGPPGATAWPVESCRGGFCFPRSVVSDEPAPLLSRRAGTASRTGGPAGSRGFWGRCFAAYLTS